MDQPREVLGQALSRLGAHIAGLYLLSEDREVLELVLLLGADREVVRPWERIALMAPMPVPDAVRDSRLVWVGGEDEMARRYPRIAVSLPYAFCLAAVPVATPLRTIGAVFALWPGSRPAELSEDEREQFTALAAQLAEALQRTGDAVPTAAGPEPVGLTRATDEYKAVTARLPEGICGMDLKGRLTAVTPTAAQLLGEPGELLLGTQPWAVLPWLRDPVYEDRYRAAILGGKPTSFVAPRPPDRWLSFRLYPDPSGLTVRITEADLPYDVPAEPAAEPPVPTRTGALYHILHLATALTEAVTVQDVVSMLADQLVPAFGAQAVAVLIAEGGRLHTVGHRGYPPGLAERFDDTPLTASTPGVQASTHPVPAFFESRADLERIYPDRPETQDTMAAWAYLPLVASGRLIGTCVLAFAEPHRFTVEERAVLTALAGLIAQALDRARLYDTKLELAHGLQQSLLPRALPAITGLDATARYLPGTEGLDVGGDFYDLIPIDRNTAAVVIGDVQGHNVTAAALMGQIRTAVRAFATADARAGTVLSRTNRLLTGLGTTLLASCAYLRVDLPLRRAWLATAGHPPPLLRTPDGHSAPVKAATGVLLNADPAAAYPLTRIDLPVGSTLVLYTDGLIEAPGIDLDDAQAELAAALARHGDRPLDELADALLAHAQEARQRTDDTALLLIRSTPR